MDCFALALLLLSLMTVVLSTIALTAYPLVSVSLVAVNPLTLVEELHADVAFRMNPTTTDGIGAITNAKATSDTLLRLPTAWQAASSPTCVDGPTNDGLAITVVSLAAVQTVVMVALTWFAPSPGSKAFAMQLEEGAQQQPSPHAVAGGHQQQQSKSVSHEDEEDRRAAQRLRDEAARSRWVVATTQRLMLVLCPCAFGVATACAAVMFVARACIEDQFTSFFNAETRRTRYGYTAVSLSWPAFFMLGVAVCNVVVGLALLHWTWLGQCGPFTAEGKRERDAEDFRDRQHAASLAADAQAGIGKNKAMSVSAMRRMSVKPSGGGTIATSPHRGATPRERQGSLAPSARTWENARRHS